MKRNYVSIMLVVVAFIAASVYSGQVSARTTAPQSIFVENFEYPAGTLLTANGWTNHSGTTNFIPVVSPGLTYTGWPSAGNAASLTNTGEDVNRAFAVQSAGSAYVGILVNISAAGPDATNGDYFFHLGPDPIGTSFRGRVFVKQDANNMLAFGISKAAGNTVPASIAYTGFNYALNTTHLLIVKYTIITGTTNDTVDLFVNPVLGGAEPAFSVTAPDVTGSDINPGTVALRQGTATSSPTLTVDGIRVANTWASLITAPPTQHVLDFNGDGKTDWTVIRNVSGGAAGQLRWYYNTNGTGAPTVALDWGLASDTLVPADYDGDGKTDIAVWRPGAPTIAAFYILQSLTNTVRIDRFGQSGDDPTIVGDYNGDGRADVATYRPGAVSGAQSTWFYRTVANGPVTYVLWGVNGDKVVPGDYDGDGKSDFVIVRNNGGQSQYWMSQTTAGFAIRGFGPYPATGMGGYTPGDYDGDGKTDLAFGDGSSGTGVFYYQPSSGTPDVRITCCNAATDELAPGDYDGDGKSDIAIWRSGIFWARFSSTGNWVNFQLGSAGDIVPQNFVH